MKLWCAFILFCAASLSCNHAAMKPADEADKKDSASQNPPSNSTAKITYADNAYPLEIFNSIPDTIEGCSGHFAVDSVSFSQKKFILLTKVDGFAILQVDGKLVFLEIQKSEDQKNVPAHQDGLQTEKYSGGGFEVILDLRPVRNKWESEETGYYSGTIKIKNGEKAITFPVWGTEGC